MLLRKFSVKCCSLLSLILVGCCLGNRKCLSDEFNQRYQLLSPAGANLVFGNGSVYPSSGIRFYSLRGSDTVFHHYGPGPNPQPGRDSLLYVNFDHQKFETVYVQWNASDIDTIRLRYETVDASPCCPDYGQSVTVAFNNALPEKGSFGEIILRK